MGDDIKIENPAVIQPELSPVEKAEKTLKDLTEKIATAEAKIKEYQAIEARRILAGNANAGIQQAPLKEESPAEYAKRVSAGKV